MLGGKKKWLVYRCTLDARSSKSFTPHSNQTRLPGSCHGRLFTPTHTKTVIFRTPEAPQLRCSAQRLANRPTEITPKSPRGCRLYTASINLKWTDSKVLTAFTTQSCLSSGESAAVGVEYGMTSHIYIYIYIYTYIYITNYVLHPSINISISNIPNLSMDNVSISSIIHPHH